MIRDDSATPGQEDLFESLVIAYDEALTRGETPSVDESRLPPQLRPRLHSALACVSLLAQAQKAGAMPVASTTTGRVEPVPLRSKIGRFEILREIGRGGHGVVFLAVDPRLRRLVAIKVPRPEVLVTPDLHRRFLREGRAASALGHPNLVPVFEVGDDGPLCYIAAGYCEGPTLANWLKKKSLPLPWHEAAELVARLADAAAHAHARGIVHRDIKPANVLLAPADAGSSGATPLCGQLVVPCLTDFGLARLVEEDAGERTCSGTMLGTPSYMAPEQADGRTQEVGPATDVYALGAVLYELLGRRPPFRGTNDLETLRLVSAAQLVHPAVLRRGLPRDLEAICLKALALTPSDRYTTAAGLAADLRRFTRGEPTEARRLGKLQQTARFLRRRPMRTALGAIVLLLIAALTVGGRWYSKRLATALEASRQANTLRDELRSAISLRSAWQAFNSDNAAQARSILRGVDAEPGTAERGFALRLLGNLTQETELRTLKGHTGDVYHVVFSPDGESLATASQDRTVRLWDTATGETRAVLAAHTDEVNAVAWSPDGRLLASASDDGTVRIWDALAGRPLSTVPRNDRGPIVSLAFSRDGALLAWGDDHGLVVLSDTATWQTAKIIETGGGRVDGLAFAHEDGWLATSTERRGGQIWNHRTSDPPKTCQIFENHARGLAFDRRDRLLCCGRSWAYYWNWQAGDEPRLLYTAPDYLNSIVFCGEDRLAATAGHDGAVRVFDLVTGELRQSLLGHAERIWCLASSPDGWRLATASADDTVKIWTIPEATPVLTYGRPTALVHAAFGGDGRTLVATRDGTVELWRLQPAGADASAPVWELADASPLGTSAGTAADSQESKGRPAALSRDLALSPDGALAATCRHGSVGVSLIDLHTGQDVGTLMAQPDETQVQTEAVAFSPDGHTLAEAVGRSIRVWNLARRRIERRMTAHDIISAIEFSPDGQRLAVAVGERLELWDIAAKKTLSSWQAHSSRINVLAFSPGGLLASAGRDRLIRLWSGATGEAVATFSGHTGSIEAICFSPDGRLLASGGGDEAAKLWSLASYDEIATLKGFPGTVNGLAFSPTNLVLAAVGGGQRTGHLRLWCAAGPDATWRPLGAGDSSAPVRP